MYAKAYDPDNAATDLGVPLKLTYYVEHDKDKETQFERTPVAKVYEQIVKDLKESVDCFTKSPQTKSFYRASKGAALLLLSRVYLYMQDWKNAEITAKELLAENKSLLDYSSIVDNEKGYAISESSPELLFSQGPLNLQCDFTGVGGDFCISNDLYKLYDENDYRKGIYFVRSTQSDSLGLNRKYEMGKHRSYVSDIFTLRTAEGYLNVAEACAMQGRMLKMFVRMIRPRKILEIGTYSGYSALCMAEGLPDDGMLYTFEINDEQEDFTRPWLENSVYADKIKFYIGNALEMVPQFDLTFDLAFIDGDKRRYIDYYEMVLPRLSDGGYIIADNTLWDGHVLEEQPHRTDLQTIGIKAFNDLIAQDSRVEKVILPLRDGLTIIRKK